MDNIELLLSELEGEMLEGKKTLFSSSSVTVNGDRIMEILSKIRSQYPEELRKAKIIIEERDAIKADAKNYVDQLMKDAKEKEQRMIAETNIMKKASQEADTLRKEADAYKQRTMYQVNRLVDEHLVSIENTVSTVLDYIRNAREELEGDMFKNKGQRYSFS